MKKYYKPKVVSPSSEIVPDDIGLAVRIEFTGRVCYKSEDRISADSSAGFCRGMVNHKHNSVLEMGVRTCEVKARTKSHMREIIMAMPKYLFIDDFPFEKRTLITGSVRAFREMLMRLPGNEIIRTIAFDMNKNHPYFFEDIASLLPVKRSRKISCRQVSLEEIDQMEPEIQARHRHLAVKFIVSRAVTHEIVRHRPCSFLQESQRYCCYSDGKFGSRITFIKPVFFKEDSEDYEIWGKECLSAEAVYMKLIKNNSPQAARTVLPNSCKTEIFVYANLAEWHHILHMRTSKAAEPSMREVMIPLQKELMKRFPEQNFGEPLRMPEGYV
ncbi:MAG: FAD-dependent thymidylate synthase [Candidatus Moranbacteria bacterium]|nr:FAD-dependent thymidylate synthase [Candidatus Moranbacteria bacterium]